MAREVLTLNEKNQNLYRDWNIDYSELPDKEQASSLPSTDKYDEEKLDKFISNNDFITPSEYYKKLNNSINAGNMTEQGYYKVSENSSESVKWFWVEDLKTWCSYKVYNNTYDELCKGMNQFVLTVWNGKTGWIRIPNLVIFPKDSADYSGTDDIFNIKDMQNAIILRFTDNFIKNTIMMARGSSHMFNEKYINRYLPGPIERPVYETPDVIDDGTLLRIKTAYNTHLMPEYACVNYLGLSQVVHAFKLQETYNYSINEIGDFQTKRWSSLGYNNVDNIGSVGNFAQSNARFGITTNVPPVYRLPTGELCLCANLFYAGDPGVGYYYKKDPNYGFRKHYEERVFREYKLEEYRMMGDDDLKTASWINQQCAAYFGEGNEKTIEKDWLRIKYTNSTSLNANYDAKVELLDSTKIFEQHNINKENNLKCKFTINRPIVTSEETTSSDYAKKW